MKCDELFGTLAQQGMDNGFKFFEPGRIAQDMLGKSGPINVVVADGWWIKFGDQGNGNRPVEVMYLFVSGKTGVPHIFKHVQNGGLAGGN